MKRLSAIAATLVVVAFTAFGCAHMGSEWVTLVDGEKGLENFNRVGDANWRAEGGAIVADKGKGGSLVSKGSYKDFEIRAELWADHHTNSGIYIRATNPQQVGSGTAYEVNINDQSERLEYATGSIVNFASNPVPLPFKAGGKWNVLEIYAKGQEMTIRLNGQVTVSLRDGSFASGPIALQYGSGLKGAMSGPVKWRKVQIRTL
jgi:hypothetical protein